jgi:MFS family permease
MLKDKITDWLKQANGLYFSVYAIFAAFSVYACMYAFRKPFTATSYEDYALFGMGFKTILVITQVLGYTLSKFVGIKVISEMTGERRALAIVALILFAEFALLLFALVPYPYNFIFLFLNGLPLGMVWGLVFSYLEGRRFTEALGAGLSISYVVSSGFVKSVGRGLMDAGVSEFWMPVATGAFFIVPLIIAVFLLDRIPPPSAQDQEIRTRRMPMDRKERRAFFGTFAPGLVMLVLMYMGLTAFRDFRDNFMAEMFIEMGVSDSSVFAISEFWVGLIVLILIGSFFLIKDNKTALILNHIFILTGLLLIGISTWLFQAGMLNPVTWMVLVGIGIYMGYIPFGCILFDRMIATFRYVSNAGFMIYVADAFGYLAAVGVMIYKDFGAPEMSWVNFFTGSSNGMVIYGSILTIASLFYFLWRERNWSAR